MEMPASLFPVHWQLLLQPEKVFFYFCIAYFVNSKQYSYLKDIISDQNFQIYPYREAALGLIKVGQANSQIELE